MDKSEERLRDEIYEAYEVLMDLRNWLHHHPFDPGPDAVSVPRDKLYRLLGAIPLIAGYALGSMPLSPMPIKTTKRLAKTMANAYPQLCVAALALILKHVDYTSRRCTPTEQIGAILPADILFKARAALHGMEPA